MPIYEYMCLDCKMTFEKIVTIKMRDEQICPLENCLSKNVVRTISASSFSLKGGGWFKDGYQKKKKESKIKK